jgi:hypothetical protein
MFQALTSFASTVIYYAIQCSTSIVHLHVNNGSACAINERQNQREIKNGKHRI